MMKGKHLCVICHDFAMTKSDLCFFCHKELEVKRKRDAYDLLAILVPFQGDISEREFLKMMEGKQ